MPFTVGSLYYLTSCVYSDHSSCPLFSVCTSEQSTGFCSEVTSLDFLTSVCSFLWSLFLEVTPFLRWGLFPVLIAWTHKDYLCLNSSCICIRQSLFVAWPCKLLALATWCKEPTHWKRPWCWERLKAGGEGDDRGWDGWMVSLTRWR